ncbi:MAG: hypothetical protein AB7S26_04120 [Sandaracinaceae bacterium]
MLALPDDERAYADANGANEQDEYGSYVVTTQVGYGPPPGTGNHPPPEAYGICGIRRIVGEFAHGRDAAGIRVNEAGYFEAFATQDVQSRIYGYQAPRVEITCVPLKRIANMPLTEGGDVDINEVYAVVKAVSDPIETVGGDASTHATIDDIGANFVVWQSISGGISHGSEAGGLPVDDGGAVIFDTYGSVTADGEVFAMGKNDDTTDVGSEAIQIRANSVVFDSLNTSNNPYDRLRHDEFVRGPAGILDVTNQWCTIGGVIINQADGGLIDYELQDATVDGAPAHIVWITEHSIAHPTSLTWAMWVRCVETSY